MVPPLVVRRLIIRIAIAPLTALAAGASLGEVAVDRRIGQFQAAGPEIDAAPHRVAAGAPIAARIADPPRPGHAIRPVHTAGLIVQQRDPRQRYAAAVDHHRAADRRGAGQSQPGVVRRIAVLDRQILEDDRRAGSVAADLEDPTALLAADDRARRPLPHERQGLSRRARRLDQERPGRHRVGIASRRTAR